MNLFKGEIVEALMNGLVAMQRRSRRSLRGIAALVLLMATTLSMVLSVAAPAFAHHPFGGRTPANFVEGFLSGLGHPVIGLDHLAFTIAVGLLAAVLSQGAWVPVAFVVATIGGTLLHIAAINLPVLEIAVSASVLGFGALLAVKDRPSAAIVAGLAAIAGIFHGYAYGEVIIGAGLMPLASYLTGFAVIQSLIALGAFSIARVAQRTASQTGDASQTAELSLRFAGFAIAGAGAAFLGGAILG
jgi:urease accessory protein